VKPLKLNKIKYSEKHVAKRKSKSPPDSDDGEERRAQSPEPPVLLAAVEADAEKEEPPKLKVVSKPKKHRRSDEERGRKKSKHKSKKSKKEKKKRRRKSRSRSRSASPPKIDRESSLSPVRFKSKSRHAVSSKDRDSVRLETPVPLPAEKVASDKHQKIEKSAEKEVEKSADVSKGVKTTSTVSSFSNGKTEPVFDSKYRSLKPDEFWKQDEPSPRESSNKAVIEKKRPPVSTKAAIKEVSPSPVPPNAAAGSSTVKTMLQVLAVASKRGKPGRKPKRDRKSLEWSDSKIGVSPGSSCHSSQRSPFSPQSSVGAESVTNPIYTHVQVTVL